MSDSTDTHELAYLALAPLEIPDAVPIPWNSPESALYGAGLAAINAGLKVFVEAYENMAVGDRVEVHWDTSGTPFASVIVDDGNLDQRLGLSLPEALFSEGDFAPFYRIRRISGLTTDGPSRAIRVQLTVPGGADPNPSTSNNENLVAPGVSDDILLQGVDAEQAAQGVDVTLEPYLKMRAYDRIDFSWGGQMLVHTVQPGEVGQALLLHVDEATILAAGDGRVGLMFQIVDAAANRSDGWSLITQVDVLASGATLDAPIVVDAVGGELALADLDGEDAAVQVLVTSEHFVVGEAVELSWAGTTEGGLSVDWGASLNVSAIPQVLEFHVPYATVAAIAQGRAVVSYQVHNNDGSMQYSRRNVVRVIGSAQLLAPPSVREAGNGALPADVAQATVDIPPYLGMAAGDLLTLIWAGEKASGEPTDYRVERTISGGAVGSTVTLTIPGDEQVAPLEGGSVTLWYQVVPAGRQQRVPVQESERLQLTVGAAVANLPAPSVLEAVDGALSADVLQATVEIAAYPGMAAGDRVDLLWQGDVTGEYSDWLPVSAGTVGHTLTFTVYPEQIAPNSRAEVSYTVTRAAGGNENSAVLLLGIGEAIQLPPPSIDQAVDGKLDPDDVPNGATVRVPAAANLAAGDLLAVHWLGTPGEGSVAIEVTVSGGQAGEDVTVVVPHSVVVANERDSIELSYEVTRVGGNAEASPVVVYDITSALGSGRLKVMGARSGLDHFSCYGDLGRRLVALDAETLEPLEAQWQYEGDTEAATGSSFHDHDRSRLLRVTSSDDEVLLNVANLCGTNWAMVARRDEGNMVAWGADEYGGAVSPAIAALTDIVEIVGIQQTFAARRANGSVVAWGSGTAATVPAVIASLTDITQLVGSRPPSAEQPSDRRYAFAVLRANGAVAAWGDSYVGGSLPAGIANLTDIVALIGSAFAFAARRANGSVVVWGHIQAGGSLPPAIATLTDIVAVVGGYNAFAARRANGSVVAWGSPDYGATVPPEIATLTDIVEIIPGVRAFAARRSNGSVVAWGDTVSGTVPPAIATLTDIIQVVGLGWGFAALRVNGTVVAWGAAEYGGEVPPTIVTLTDIVALTANGFAVCALRRGGEVEAWGNTSQGGNSSVVANLVNVRAVYGGGLAFAALRDDKQVVTWGNNSFAGNSSAVTELLNGHVSYEATPISRGAMRRRS